MSIVSQFKSREDRIEEHIKEIYFMVQEYFQDLILTGSSALFIYLKALNYKDLLFQLGDPNDVDLLVVHHEKFLPKFNIQQLGLYSPKQTTLESSITLTNGRNSFDLTYVSDLTRYNRVAGFNLLTLQSLKDQYSESRPENEAEKTNADEKKIGIIDKILLKLSQSSRPDIIGPELSFKPQTQSSIRTDFGGVARSLFGSNPESFLHSSQPGSAAYSSGLANLAQLQTSEPATLGLSNLAQTSGPAELSSPIRLGNLAQLHKPVRGPGL